ncbi:hypothetical protein AB6F64_22175 [Providencia hangzhouensis]|nr:MULTISPECIES: hypothetical protein [Enterobacterales]MCJ4607306.1 hypothetical protein [Klebsiella pneumoniae]HDZ7422022.1 hypothetical protein [Escherichia coli]ALV81797.1 hypothetical protein AOY08_100079 [Providencia rettgeri]APC14148.1 hypothetical protein RB151_P104581 [Providencia rettgeri]ARV76049.1 hypothetical protein PRE19_0000004238 [Providencia rettgeri]
MKTIRNFMSIKSICFVFILATLFAAHASKAANILTLSNRDAIQFEQRQRLESELNQRQLLETQNNLILNKDGITPLKDIFAHQPMNRMHQEQKMNY